MHRINNESNGQYRYEPFVFEKGNVDKRVFAFADIQKEQRDRSGQNQNVNPVEVRNVQHDRRRDRSDQKQPDDIDAAFFDSSFGIYFRISGSKAIDNNGIRNSAAQFK